MDHYLDLHLRPDPETAPAHLMNALFGKLHHALVARPGTQIGISFPGFNAAAPHLGNSLRLHGGQADLQTMLPTGWLHGLQDHVRVQPLAPVPPQTLHRVVRRVQAKSSPDRLRRRQMRRHGYDAAEALRRNPAQEGRQLDLPYVSLQSTSTGQAFRLFIEHGPVLAQAHTGVFTTYGLGVEATVPWF